MRRVDVKSKRKAKDFIFEQNKSGIVLPQEIFNKVHAVVYIFQFIIVIGLPKQIREDYSQAVARLAIVTVIAMQNFNAIQTFRNILSLTYLYADLLAQYDQLLWLAYSTQFTWKNNHERPRNDHLYQNIFQASSETVTVVSVIYDTLAFILGDVNTTSNLSSYYALSNSRIISSTVKPLGEEQLKQPVRIVLENNGTVGCTRIHAQRIISCTVMVKRSYTFHCSSIPATCTYISFTRV